MMKSYFWYGYSVNKPIIIIIIIIIIIQITIQLTFTVLTKIIIFKINKSVLEKKLSDFTVYVVHNISNMKDHV